MKAIRSGILALGVGVVAIALSPLRAQAADAKGDLWETSSQMSMEGMPMQMPAHKAKVCTRRDRSEPPVAENPQGHCANSDFKHDGNKITWKVKCTGPDMTGTGEILYSDPSSYSGTIHFSSDEASMTIKLAGKKLGECDSPQ